MEDKFIEAKKAFEETFEVPDFLIFDGEDYMYYEEDPVLEEQSRNTGAQWRGFSAAWKRFHQPKHETVEQWEKRTGETYPDDGPVWMEIYNCNGLNGGMTLHLVTWNIARQSEPLITPRIIVANHHGKPEV